MALANLLPSVAKLPRTVAHVALSCTVLRSVVHCSHVMSRDRTAPPNSSTARARLAALSEEQGSADSSALPEIKAALDSGHSHESVCECLAADGIKVSARSLASYVSRIRRASTDARDRTVSLRANSKPSAPPQDQASTRTSPESKPRSSEDPLANVRERERKRSGFDYRPELADPKDLI